MTISKLDKAIEALFIIGFMILVSIACISEVFYALERALV